VINSKKCKSKLKSLNFFINPDNSRYCKAQKWSRIGHMIFQYLKQNS